MRGEVDSEWGLVSGSVGAAISKSASGKFAGGKVHERLELEGTVQELEGELEHHSFRDAADHWARCETYARLWAEMKFEEGQDC